MIGDKGFLLSIWQLPPRQKKLQQTSNQIFVATKKRLNGSSCWLGGKEKEQINQKLGSNKAKEQMMLAWWQTKPNVNAPKKPKTEPIID
jgi:hypothetical protein